MALNLINKTELSDGIRNTTPYIKNKDTKIKKNKSIIKAEDLSFRSHHKIPKYIKNKRVVVTGVGLISAAGNAAQLWEKSLNGISCIDQLTQHPQKYGFISYGGEVKADLDNVLPKRLNNYLTRSAKMAAYAIKDCFEDSQLNDRQAGLIYSTASLGADNLMNFYSHFVSGDLEKFEPRRFLAISPSGTAQYLANFFKLTGRVSSVVRASASGLSSLVDGYFAIQTGLSERVFCCASDDNLTEEVVVFYKKIDGRKQGFLGDPSKDPQQCLTLFGDAETSNQAALGEAASCLLIETLESALERKANIYAEITGVGDYFYSEGFSGIDRNQIGMKTTVLTCCEEKSVDYVVQSATGYRLIDMTNYITLYNLLGAVHTTSIEPIIAHTGAPTGLLNSYIACKSILTQTVVPTINVASTKIDEEFKLIYTKTPLQKTINDVLVIASGYGGYSSAALLSKYR